MPSEPPTGFTQRRRASYRTLNVRLNESAFTIHCSVHFVRPGAVIRFIDPAAAEAAFQLRFPPGRESSEPITKNLCGGGFWALPVLAQADMGGAGGNPAKPTRTTRPDYATLTSGRCPPDRRGHQGRFALVDHRGPPSRGLDATQLNVRLNESAFTIHCSVHFVRPGAVIRFIDPAAAEAAFQLRFPPGRESSEPITKNLCGGGFWALPVLAQADMGGAGGNPAKPTRTTRPDYATLTSGCPRSRLRDSHSAGGLVTGH